MAPGGFQFVHISNPAEAANHRKKVRAHAARNSKARREKVAEFQAQDRAQHKDAAVVASETSEANRSSADGGQVLELLPSPLIGKLIPSPQTLLSPVWHDPFNSFIRPVAPFEGYLLKHFIQHVVMNDLSAQPCLHHLSNDAFTLGSAITWTREAAIDVGMLALILLVACRSLAKLQHSTIYEPVALRYKALCLRYLSDTISREGDNVSDTTITKTLAMASEEFFSSNKTAADQHLRAAVQMVNMRRGPVMVGMWKHDDNLHLWSHWEHVAAGEATDDICVLQMRSEQTSAGSAFDELHISPEASALPARLHQRRYDQLGPAFKTITLTAADDDEVS
ncbi:hypothetical protein HYQ45_006302 [Verticillium longisporum]|uniref:Uncharacterized protein n=1 Tax=Verticillium longisporum TaxID=100787 RepID=A0A0G4KPB4_VERLO|nr:hypothetical protein HYQ44_005368 [Verticillium longisporum]KAG7136052.1 hypothetical protein HYQ45_006302 [Verticillium longisporum]CRK11594.1 hypothetical protein BN1723_009408 [Verticillium longisporum]CRK33930.1 hypothetical protein BN1708_006199 [Verticillium longisporum]